MENILDAEQIVTFPGDDSDDATERDVMPPSTELMQMPGGATIGRTGAGDSLLVSGDGTITFEEKRTTNATQRKVTTDGFSSEQATSNSSQTKHLQAGDVDYREETAVAAVRKKIEVGGVTAEQNEAAINVSAITARIFNRIYGFMSVIFACCDQRINIIRNSALYGCSHARAYFAEQLIYAVPFVCMSTLAWTRPKHWCGKFIAPSVACLLLWSPM